MGSSAHQHVCSLRRAPITDNSDPLVIAGFGNDPLSDDTATNDTATETVWIPATFRDDD